MPSPADRFEAKVDRGGEHHLWNGARKANGTGQVRIDGRLVTAPRFAWELIHGPLPSSAKVVGCPAEPACVRVEHLTVTASPHADQASSPPPTMARRAGRGGGAKRELRPGVWKLTVVAGSETDGRPKRAYRTVRGSEKEATKALAAFVAEVGDGGAIAPRSKVVLTVDDLVAWYLAFARDDRGLDHSTVTGYEDVYRNWLKPQLGHLRTSGLKNEQLTRAFGGMRRAGMSHSRMNNARALLSGAYKWGKRQQKVSSNPVEHFELPSSTHVQKETTPPELPDLIRLLNGADEHDAELSPVLKLGATTGMRRGELAGLKRDRLHLDRAEIVVNWAINDAGGVVVEKASKTRKTRTVSIDPATVQMLREHLAAMDDRAGLFGAVVASNAFVFSLDPECAKPMRPELMTRRMRQLRKKLDIDIGDFDATILALRKWTSSELMDAGFNPSAVSGRQGHTVQVMLKHYSKRRQSADIAAAAHLGRQVHGLSD